MFSQPVEPQKPWKQICLFGELVSGLDTTKAAVSDSMCDYSSQSKCHLWIDKSPIKLLHELHKLLLLKLLHDKISLFSLKHHSTT